MHGITNILSRQPKPQAKKQLIIDGVVAEVCTAFPALSALEEDLEVFVVTDASGTFNELTRARSEIACLKRARNRWPGLALHANCVATGAAALKAWERGSPNTFPITATLLPAQRIGQKIKRRVLENC